MRGITAKDFGNLLVNNGWQLKHKKGSHITYFKPGYSHIITLCDHRSEMSRPLAQRLMKEAGILVH